MEIRWKCKCGYNLTKRELRSSIEEGDLSKPSSLVITCPSCMEAIKWFDLTPFFLSGNNGLEANKIENEERQKRAKAPVVPERKKFKFRKKDFSKIKERSVKEGEMDDKR